MSATHAGSVSLVDRSRAWRLWAPLVAVVLALAALVAVPVLGDWYVAPLHHEMRDVAEPGRSLVTEIHVARRCARTRAHRITRTLHGLARSAQSTVAGARRMSHPRRRASRTPRVAGARDGGMAW